MHSIYIGSVPFVTEDDAVGAFLPEQISKADLFAYIESELLAIEAELADPGTNEYGRVDQAAAWTLLAKLYLNAEVYIGTPKYTECITYCQEVISQVILSIRSIRTCSWRIINNSPEIIFPVDI